MSGQGRKPLISISSLAGVGRRRIGYISIFGKLGGGSQQSFTISCHSDFVESGLPVCWIAVASAFGALEFALRDDVTFNGESGRKERLSNEIETLR